MSAHFSEKIKMRAKSISALLIWRLLNGPLVAQPFIQAIKFIHQTSAPSYNPISQLFLSISLWKGARPSDDGGLR